MSEIKDLQDRLGRRWDGYRELQAAQRGAEPRSAPRERIERRLAEARASLDRLAWKVDHLRRGCPDDARVFSTWLLGLRVVLDVLARKDKEDWLHRACAAADSSPLPGAMGELALMLADKVTKERLSALTLLRRRAPEDPVVVAAWVRGSLPRATGDELAELCRLLGEARRAAPRDKRVRAIWLDGMLALTEALRRKRSWARLLAQESAILHGIEEGSGTQTLCAARLFRNLGIACYEHATTSPKTLARLDALRARCAALSTDSDAEVAAERVWLERYGILARCDLAWDWAPDGGVRWTPDAPRLLQEADEALAALSQPSLVEATTAAARGHLAAAARSLHYVLLQPGCPAGERAGPWLAALTSWRAFAEPEIDREWAYAASDCAMHLAEAGEERSAAEQLAAIWRLYQARETAPVRRALGKAIAACGRFDAHRIGALRRLAALRIFFEDEEYARFFALRAKAAVLDAAAGGAFALGEQLVAVMEAVARRRPAPLLLRQMADTLLRLGESAPPAVALRCQLRLQALAGAFPGEEKLAAATESLGATLWLRGLVASAAPGEAGPEAALPWPALALRRSAPLCLCDELGLEMFLPRDSLTCAWSSATSRIVSLNRAMQIEGYLWSGVPTDQPRPVLTISLRGPALDPREPLRLELLDGARSVKIEPSGLLVALPWPADGGS